MVLDDSIYSEDMALGVDHIIMELLYLSHSFIDFLGVFLNVNLL